MTPIAWYRCPKCGKLALVDTSKVFTSYPAQYSYYCPHCNESGYCLCTDVTIQSKDTYILCGDVTYYHKDWRIIAKSFCYNLKILV